jgi:uncharacterized protein YodC (DUF2158 family)
MQVGDIVKLNSGGPPMTVTRIENHPNGDVMVYTVWFDKEDRYSTGTFLNVCLKS